MKDKTSKQLAAEAVAAFQRGEELARMSLLQLIKEQGSQRLAAESVGMSEVHLSNIMRGTAKVGAELLKRISEG